MQIVVLVALGIVFIIVISVTFFSSKRAISFAPPEVHMHVGSVVTLYALLYRKKAWSYNLAPSTAPRNVTFTNPGGSTYSINGPNPAVVAANGGLASVQITGANPGTGTLRAEAASSRPGKTYGPMNLRVNVYSADRPLPPGITLTPAG